MVSVAHCSISHVMLVEDDATCDEASLCRGRECGYVNHSGDTGDRKIKHVKVLRRVRRHNIASLSSVRCPKTSCSLLGFSCTLHVFHNCTTKNSKNESGNQVVENHIRMLESVSWLELRHGEPVRLEVWMLE